MNKERCHCNRCTEIREDSLLAEIARLRGALRAIAKESRLIAENAEVNLVLTPEDMKE